MNHSFQVLRYINSFTTESLTSNGNEHLLGRKTLAMTSDLVTLMSAEGDRFEINRSSLESNSDYFCALFRSGMRECDSKTIQIDMISSHTMTKVVEFFSSCKTIVNLDDFEEVLIASRYLQASQLEQFCCGQLAELLSVDSYFQVREIVRRHTLDKLVTEMHR